MLQLREVESLFMRHGVISPVEMACRYEVYGEQYSLASAVEAKVAWTMVHGAHLDRPAVQKHLSALARSLQQEQFLGPQPETREFHQITALHGWMDEHATALEERVDDDHWPLPFTGRCFSFAEDSILRIPIG